LSGTAKHPEETKAEKEEEEEEEEEDREEETLWGIDMFAHMAMLEEKRRGAGEAKTTMELAAFPVSATSNSSSFISSPVSIAEYIFL